MGRVPCRIGGGARAALPAMAAVFALAPILGSAQEPATDEASFSVELRVEIRDYFPGPWSGGDAGTWRARYVETGEWTFTRTQEIATEFEFSGKHSVLDLEASASPVLVDGCGHQWVRKWTDPARVEWESTVSVEAALDESVVAVWYTPIRPSLQDPGGPRGKGDCYDPDEEDERTRGELLFDPSDLEGRVDTESGLPAVRSDGRILLALVPWAELTSGDPVTRRVGYGDSRVRFRARLELTPLF